MKQLIAKILASLDTHTQGFSARKLSALAVMVCILTAHGAWLKNAFVNNDFSLLTTVLTIDYGFIGLCLGLTTYQAIKESKPNEPTT